MKKSTKKLLSVCLVVIMLFTTALPTFAMSENLWDVVWESDDAKAGITMFPGTDETERGFTWYTAENNEPSVIVSTNMLMLGAEAFTGTTATASEGDFANHVTITGLEAETTYYYQCKSGDFTSQTYSFTTAAEDEFKAVYMTDIHITDDEENPEMVKETAFNFHNTMEDVLTREPDVSLLISAGDQASDGLESEYKAFSASPLLKSVSVSTTIGNHDRKGAEYKTFTNLPNEYTQAAVKSYIGGDYWYVKGDVLFLVADSNCASGKDHAAFVENAINANPDVKWKVLVAHHDLYSGRIPHRESENAILRLIWAPIADEFGIDLVLLGHSHYYTVSNVLYNGKTVAPLESEMTDAEGSIYMVSCSINRPRGDDEIGLNEEIGFDYLTQEPTYNILTCTEDAITVESYEVGAEEAFNSFTLTKTSANGGHPEEVSALTSMFNSFVRTVSTIYAFFDNIGNYTSLKEQGYEVDFFECVFGKKMF